MTDQLDYAAFLRRKTDTGSDSGFAPTFFPEKAFDFQNYMIDWNVRKGRSAMFEECGLGKTLQELAWAQNVVEHTNGRVLILTPLAVGAQTVLEGEKFGIEARQSRDGSGTAKITVTNYERLHYFDPDDFVGVVGDESSAIKAFDGKRRKDVTRFAGKMRFRLLATATPSPNDFIELGTASECLGYLSQSDMLGTFFKASDNARHSLFREGDYWNRAKWFFRAHSETPFWRWVCSWAKAIRKPSDLGFDDSRFILPPLEVVQHIVNCDIRFDGELFHRVAQTLAEQREERRASMRERCEKVAALVDHSDPAVVWCQYNDEGDMLERMIPGCVQVAGADSDDEKEERFLAFTRGEVRVLVTKPKIGAWGLNWQHCGHQTFFPSHSFEQYYQAVRRSLRFGRVGPVRIDVVATEGEAGVTANLQKKQIKADEMFARLLEEMNRAQGIERHDNHVAKMEAPAWL